MKSLSHVRLLATPWTAAHQASPPMGFSRQEYWSGVPLPSLERETKATCLDQSPLCGVEGLFAFKSLQSCLTLCDPTDSSPPGSPLPGILQARALEWVAISLLQCMNVKSESDVTQSCPTLSDPTDCSPPGSSIHGIFQARVLEWGATAFFVSTKLKFS